MGEKSHTSALVKSRDAIFSRLFVEQTVLEDRGGVSWSKGQICLMSSEIMFPTEKRQVCLLSIIKDRSMGFEKGQEIVEHEEIVFIV